MANDSIKKNTKRMAKEERHDAKFWADGGRERILNRYVALMADAMAKGWRPMREVVKLARREFDYHVDWRLQDHEEPAQPFRQWTPDTPREPLTLTAEEEKERAIWSETMNARIRRWLIYRAKKLVKMYNQTRAVDIDDPYVRLIAKFLKIERLPKARQASQEWSHEMYDSLVKETVNTEWAAHKVKKGLPGDMGVTMGFRGEVTRRMFEELVPPEERGEWKKKAAATSKTLKEEYKATLDAPYPQDPESRQEAINNFTKFITPLLEGCSEIMGLKIICIAGGPMPRFNGAIRTIGVPIGLNKDPIPSSFPEYNTQHYAAVLEVYKHWLGTCYNAQDTAESRLGDENDAEAEDVKGIVPLLARLREMHEDMDYEGEEDDSDEGDDDDGDDNAQERNEEGSARNKGKKRAHTAGSEESRKRRAGAPNVAAVKAKKAATKARTNQKSTAGSAQRTPVEPAIAQSVPAQPEDTTTANPGGGLLMMSGDIDMGEGSTLTLGTMAGGGEGGSAGHSAGTLPASQPFSFSEWGDPNDPMTWGMGWMDTAGGDKELGGWNGEGASSFAENASIMSALAASAIANGNGLELPDASGHFGGSNLGNYNQDFGMFDGFDGGIAPQATLLVNKGIPPQATQLYTGGSQDLSYLHGSVEKILEAPRHDSGLGASETSHGVHLGDINIKHVADWFRVLWELLRSDELGARYVSMMRAWLALETAHQFDNPRSGLTASRRPAMVGAWIKRGRKALLGVGERQKLPSVQAFRVEYWSWWEFVQPEWRKRSESGEWTVKRTEDSWETLNVCGVNGLVGIVACLRWWGDKILAMEGEAKGSEMAVWEKAVIDAAWVMNELRLAANT